MIQVGEQDFVDPDSNMRVMGYKRNTGQEMTAIWLKGDFTGEHAIQWEGSVQEFLNATHGSMKPIGKA